MNSVKVLENKWLGRWWFCYCSTACWLAHEHQVRPLCTNWKIAQFAHLIITIIIILIIIIIIIILGQFIKRRKFWFWSSHQGRFDFFNDAYIWHWNRKSRTLTILLKFDRRTYLSTCRRVPKIDVSTSSRTYTMYDSVTLISSVGTV